MSLRKYVRQVRPVQENYIAPEDKIQVLSEAKSTASTLFEGVIADCANASTNKVKFKKEILNQPYVSQFLPLADKMSGAAGKTAFATKGKTDEEKLDILWKFSQACKKALRGNSVDAGAGQSKKKVSDPWVEMSEKRGGVDTSKADIMVGSFQTSVKGPAALLMSGEKKEAKATVLSVPPVIVATFEEPVEGLVLQSYTISILFVSGSKARVLCDTVFVSNSAIAPKDIALVPAVTVPTALLRAFPLSPQNAICL